MSSFSAAAFGLFICDVYEMFNHNCVKVLVPDKFPSLDESFYPTRVGVAFRQYSKSKPTKYALPFRSLNSAKMSLTYNSVYMLVNQLLNLGHIVSLERKKLSRA